MISHFRQHLRNELETTKENRRFGSGWISGVIALIGSVVALGMQICILFPALFTTPQLHELYLAIPVRFLLYAILIGAFCLALISLVLRGSKILGFTAVIVILATTVLGGFGAQFSSGAIGNIFFGLDWFILNILFTGALFIPIERLFPKWPDQSFFREEWREDLFYYFISSMLVQVLTFLSLWPSMQIIAHTPWEHFRKMVGEQSFVLQLLEIMLLTDLVQYGVHRAFHCIPALWNFHAVHHSAKTLDWMAGARMHLIEILLLRGLSVIPMMVLGYSEIAAHGYILLVYIYATLIHANIRWSPLCLSGLIVTPRYHHWHHGIEKEAININFAIHFPFLDKLFGTYYMPEKRWPSGYGIKDHPVPVGYITQFIYPFSFKKK